VRPPERGGYSDHPCPLGSRSGRFGSTAKSVRDHRYPGAENRVEGKNDQGVSAPVSVEVNDVAHRGDGSTGRQDLTKGSPEAREKLGGRAAARGGVADDQKQDRAERRPGYSENHLKSGEASDENVAVFGDFRYRSHSLGKIVSSPFSIFLKVVDGQVTYLQFLEDSYATASSFR
jgi:ketosteroid isomerase-like protein